MDKQKIQFSQNEDSTVIHAYDHIAFNMLEEQTLYGYKSFLFCGCEARVGTTTVVTELAILLAHMGKRVLILDGDFRKRAPHSQPGETAFPGIADYVSNPDVALKDCLQMSNIKGLYFLSSGRPDHPNTRHILYAPRFKDAMGQLKQHFDIILIDTGDVETSGEALALAATSDAVVLICALNGAPRSKLIQARQKLSKIKCNLIGVIENMVEMNQYETYMRNYGYITPPAAEQKEPIQPKSAQKKDAGRETV